MAGFHSLVTFLTMYTYHPVLKTHLTLHSQTFCVIRTLSTGLPKCYTRARRPAAAPGSGDGGGALQAAHHGQHYRELAGGLQRPGGIGGAAAEAGSAAGLPQEDRGGVQRRCAHHQPGEWMGDDQRTCERMT